MIEVIETTDELYPYQNLVNSKPAEWFYSNPFDTRLITYRDDIDVRPFSEEANKFLKNGCYTTAIEGTKEYNQYWDEQERRCLNGYTVDGLWITGRHYFYLNFFPIEKSMPDNPDPVFGFPDFWEMDYTWWIVKHIAKKLGFNLSVLKTRRSGFSYKEGADCVFNYNFLANSKSYIYAQAEVYLIGDRIMDKVRRGLDHLNAHTDWYKNRHKGDKGLHYKASYIEGNVQKGFESEIIAKALDNPNKARGGKGVKITFEEAGSFKGLTTAWAISNSMARENGMITGQLTCFGTGGDDMGEGALGLETIFFDPESYDIMPFMNVWDEGKEGTICGYFASCIDSFSDRNPINGKVNVHNAIAFYTKERQKKKKATDPSALDKAKAETPLCPKEALLKLSGNIFPVGLCNDQETFIMQNKSLQASILYGELQRVKDEAGYEKVKFKPSKGVEQAVNQYPIKKGFMSDGAIVIYQTPYEADNMYFLVLDPYAKDEAPESDSIGACFIYKRASAILVDKDRPADCIVASYVARPKTLEEYLKNVFLLAQYYRAKIYFEASSGGGQSVIDYARNNNMTNYLAFQPIHLTNKEVASYKNRSYGVNMTTEVKNSYLRRFADWLIGERELTENGYVLNLNLIYDTGLLKELQKFNDKGNFDRISASILIAILMEDIITNEIDDGKVNERDKFFSKLIFTPPTANMWEGKRYL